jgi:hypothetical protein
MAKYLTKQFNLIAQRLLEQQEKSKPIHIQRMTLTTRAVFRAPCKHSW